MQTVLEERDSVHAARILRPGLALVPALALVYAPTFLDLARGAWRDDAYAHGPLILAISAFLAWRERHALERIASGAPRWGLTLVFAGLVLWLLGRTQGLMPIEAGSLLPLAAGLALLAWGRAGLSRLAFAIAFLAFYVPLPGFMLDALTNPLKELVSSIVAHALAFVGHTVTLGGVVITVDGQEMLVADACSGLNSIVSLLALGLLYAHLRRATRARMALLVLAVIPIAVAANVLRVLALALVVTHYGPEAAQGWVHEALGMSVFVIALLFLVAFDRIVNSGLDPFPPAPPNSFFTPDLLRKQDRKSELGGVGGSGPVTVLALVAMAGVAFAAPSLKPRAEVAPIDLEVAVPSAFGEWRVDPHVMPVAPAPDVQANLARLYDQVVARTYVNAQGERMMLTVAHGGDQSDALKAHRQEVCYRAQGFRVGALEHATLAADGREIPVTRFVATRGERSEPVTYWFTMGDRVVLGRLERLRVQLENGLRGRLPDGMLVRVSSLDPDAGRAHAAQRAFVAALAAAVPREDVPRLIGAAPR
jgi:EpsI family protein